MGMDWESRKGPYPDGVESVVIDWDAPKRMFLRAGYYLGNGLPVVYLAPARGETKWDNGIQVSWLGGYVVRVQEFPAWLASDPPYLKRELMSCPSCGSFNREVLPVRAGDKDTEPIRRCMACKKVYPKVTMPWAFEPDPPLPQMT